MAATDYWLKDKNGNLAGSVHGVTDDAVTFAANCAKNGQTPVEMGPDPSVTKPPDPPLTAAGQKVADAAARLAVITATPWSSLTLAQQKQAVDDSFICGRPVPTITATA